MAIDTDVMFVAMTRPAMIKGVPYEAMLFNGFATGVAFLGSAKIQFILVCIPIHAIFYLMCLHEPRIFELIGLWLKTKGQNLLRSFWKASSYSPLEAFREETAPTPKEGKK